MRSRVCVERRETRYLLRDEKRDERREKREKREEREERREKREREKRSVVAVCFFVFLFFRFFVFSFSERIQKSKARRRYFAHSPTHASLVLPVMRKYLDILIGAKVLFKKNKNKHTREFSRSLRIIAENRKVETHIKERLSSCLLSSFGVSFLLSCFWRKAFLADHSYTFTNR